MPPPDLTIRRGVCHALFAFDLGLSIDLDRAERILAPRAGSTEQRDSIRRTRRAPKYFEFHPAPLRITQAAEPLALKSCSTAAGVDIVLFDFGAASVSYSIPLTGPVGDLLDLSNDLYENEALLTDARRRMSELVAALGAAVVRPQLASFVEDYLIFQIMEHDAPPEALHAWIDQHRLRLAQILRAARQDLSPQEVDDAFACRLSYAVTDMALIDWNASILFDADPEDARTAIEFANVEMLEMRHLDDRLDTALEHAYQTLQNKAWHRHVFSVRFGAELRRISELQMESALLFEGVNNALKLLGDQYLARVYHLAAQRQHLPEWDASILRKLGTLESIYQKMHDRQATRRMEMLEWIVILLIAFEIVMSFVWTRARQ